MANSTVNDFVAKVTAFFKSAEADFGKFAAAFLPKVEATVEAALEDLAEIAGKAILGEALKTISGAEKFGNAVTNVVQTVEAQSKTVILATAQNAVQTAYLTAVDVAKGK